MNNQRLLLIVNPISGTADKSRLPQFVSQGIKEAMGYDVDLKKTTAKGDANRFAKEAVEQGYYGVIVAGGDGTVNEVATALCDTNVALGIIPSGSGNGLARHLEIPVDYDLSLEVIKQNNVVSCDYATVNDRPFFCTFGVGFDAAVSDRFSKQSKRGRFMYFKSAIEEYIKFEPQVYTISANGKIFTQNAFLVACCNASQYGNNAYIAPDASMSDGLLDIIIIHAGSPIDTAMLGVDLFTGYINRNTLLQSFQAPAAVIYRSQEGTAHIDGDPIDLGEIMDVKCHRSGLKIFVPKGKHRHFRPIITPINNIVTDARILMSNFFNKRKK